MSDKKHLAIFPGTFDPVSLGHLDIITRGSKLVSELVVAIGGNPEKHPMLDRETRVKIIEEVTVDLPNVSVATYDGLTVNFAQELGASAILRGLRNHRDLSFELELAHTNRLIAQIETVFLMSDPRYAYTSGTLIRQAVKMGADVASLVPAKVLPYLRQ